MFWVITASVLFGIMLGACMGVMVISLVAVSSRANESIRVRDRT